MMKYIRKSNKNKEHSIENYWSEETLTIRANQTRILDLPKKNNKNIKKKVKTKKKLKKIK